IRAITQSVIGAIAYKVLSIVGTAMTGSYIAWAACFDGKPPHLVILFAVLGMLTVAVLFAVVGYLVSNYRQPKSGTLQLQTVDESTIKQLEAQVKEFKQEKEQYGWLHKMADEQAKNISQYVIVQNHFRFYEKSLHPLSSILLGW